MHRPDPRRAPRGSPQDWHQLEVRGHRAGETRPARGLVKALFVRCLACHARPALQNRSPLRQTEATTLGGGGSHKGGYIAHLGVSTRGLWVYVRIRKYVAYTPFIHVRVHKYHVYAIAI